MNIVIETAIKWFGIGSIIGFVLAMLGPVLSVAQEWFWGND